MVGQDHITKTLVKSFEKNRIAQAFLFAGPRGVGKTTTARLLAMCLNGSEEPSRYFIETPSAFKPSDKSVSKTCELIKIGKIKITR